MEGNSLNEHNREQHIGLSTLSGLKHDQKYGSSVIREHLLTFGLDCQGRGDDKVGKLIQEGLGKRYMDRPLRTGTGYMKIFMFHANTYHRASLEEEAFNNQVDKMMLS